MTNTRSVIQFRLSAEERAALDEARGATKISDFIRQRLFEKLATPATLPCADIPKTPTIPSKPVTYPS